MYLLQKIHEGANAIRNKEGALFKVIPIETSIFAENICC